MNSKLRDILSELFMRGVGSRLDDVEDADERDKGILNLQKHYSTEAEKAIRQAVGEEMLELVGKDGDVHDKENPSWTEMRYDAAQLGINNLKAELRQKIKQWQGGEDA